MHKAFTVHMLNDDGKRKAIAIADAFDRLLAELEQHCPLGRELSLVVTKLEEAAFFAKKAMANDAANGTEAPGTAQSVPTADGRHVLVEPAAPPPAPAVSPPTSTTGEPAAPNVTQTEGDPFAVHR